MPRFRKLEPGHVIEKAAGDLVTIADRAAEERLTAALHDLMPGSTVVGEEAVAADAALLDRLLGEQHVWIIDPIDGTTNFIEGRNEFAVMVCLARKGELVASWIHRPVTGATAIAEAGGGAWIDGDRVHLSEPPDTAAQMTGTLLAGTYGDKLYNKRLQQRRNRVQAVRSSHSAAIEYLAPADRRSAFLGVYEADALGSRARRAAASGGRWPCRLYRPRGRLYAGRHRAPRLAGGAGPGRLAQAARDLARRRPLAARLRIVRSRHGR